MKKKKKAKKSFGFHPMQQGRQRTGAGKVLAAAGISTSAILLQVEGESSPVCSTGFTAESNRKAKGMFQCWNSDLLYGAAGRRGEEEEKEEGERRRRKKKEKEGEERQP